MISKPISYREIAQSFRLDYIAPPLESEDLIDLGSEIRGDDFPVPCDYMELLSQMNGFVDLPGIAFYSANHADDSLDLLTKNRAMRWENPQAMRTRLVIGESKNCLFAFNAAAPEHAKYERLSDDFVIEQSFPSLSLLLASILDLKMILGREIGAYGSQVATYHLQ